jgi:hypothetical protein
MEGRTVRKFVNTVLLMILLALVLGLLLAIGAETGKPGTEKRTEGMSIKLSKEEIPRLVEIIRIWKLVDELELKEKQLVGFLPKFKELNSLRAKHYRDRRNAVNKLRKLLEAGSSEDQLKSAMDELKNIEATFYQKHKQLQDALNSDLTVKQQAKFAVFQDKYRDDIRRLIRNLRELSNLREQRPKPQPMPSRGKKEE